MPRPHVTMHMTSSLDGNIVLKPWPKAIASKNSETYEEIHQRFRADAWIVGRVSMAEFGKGEPRPAVATETYPRTTWKAPGAERGPYAIALDQSGRMHININRANGDAIVFVLVESVADDFLAELRRDGISYLFAGKETIDLERMLDLLVRDFGIGHLLLEGGGGINGSFLTAGLIDEISLLLVPVADGTPGPSTFTRPAGLGGVPLALTSVDRLPNDVLHLRYRVNPQG